MGGISTRNRIAKSAIDLFNQDGLQNVRLQHIADKAGISVGNLAYHFHDKEQIVKKIDEIISGDISKLIGNWHKNLGFIDFDNQLARIYHLLDKYSFYFLDILEIKRLYQEVHQSQQHHIQTFIDQLNKWLDENAERGMLAEARQSGQYGKVAEMIWFICSFWMSKKKILGHAEFYEGAFKEVIWQQLSPLMTEQGKSEFEIMIQPGLAT